MPRISPRFPRGRRKRGRSFRGVRRHFAELGFATVDELPLASGRRADITALGSDGSLSIVEVKSSIEDFRVDQKWPFYRAHCDRLYFATTVRVPQEIFPADCGLIIADAYGGDHPRGARTPAGGSNAQGSHPALCRLAAMRLLTLLDPQP